MATERNDATNDFTIVRPSRPRAARAGLIPFKAGDTAEKRMLQMLLGYYLQDHHHLCPQLNTMTASKRKERRYLATQSDATIYNLRTIAKQVFRTSHMRASPDNPSCMMYSEALYARADQLKAEKEGKEPPPDTGKKRRQSDVPKHTQKSKSPSTPTKIPPFRSDSKVPPTAAVPTNPSPKSPVVGPNAFHPIVDTPVTAFVNQLNVATPNIDTPGPTVTLATEVARLVNEHLLQQSRDVQQPELTLAMQQQITTAEDIHRNLGIMIDDAIKVDQKFQRIHSTLEKIQQDLTAIPDTETLVKNIHHRINSTQANLVTEHHDKLTMMENDFLDDLERKMSNRLKSQYEQQVDGYGTSLTSNLTEITTRIEKAKEDLIEFVHTDVNDQLILHSDSFRALATEESNQELQDFVKEQLKPTLRKVMDKEMDIFLKTDVKPALQRYLDQEKDTYFAANHSPIRTKLQQDKLHQEQKIQTALDQAKLQQLKDSFSAELSKAVDETKQTMEAKYEKLAKDTKQQQIDMEVRIGKLLENCTDRQDQLEKQMVDLEFPNNNSVPDAEYKAKVKSQLDYLSNELNYVHSLTQQVNDIETKLDHIRGATPKAPRDDSNDFHPDSYGRDPRESPMFIHPTQAELAEMDRLTEEYYDRKRAAANTTTPPSRSVPTTRPFGTHTSPTAPTSDVPPHAPRFANIAKDFASKPKPPTLDEFYDRQRGQQQRGETFDTPDLRGFDRASMESLYMPEVPTASDIDDFYNAFAALLITYNIPILPRNQLRRRGVAYPRPMYLSHQVFTNCSTKIYAKLNAFIQEDCKPLRAILKFCAAGQDGYLALFHIVRKYDPNLQDMPAMFGPTWHGSMTGYHYSAALKSYLQRQGQNGRHWSEFEVAAETLQQAGQHERYRMVANNYINSLLAQPTDGMLSADYTLDSLVVTLEEAAARHQALARDHGDTDDSAIHINKAVKPNRAKRQVQCRACKIYGHDTDEQTCRFTASCYYAMDFIRQHPEKAKENADTFAMSQNRLAVNAVKTVIPQLASLPSDEQEEILDTLSMAFNNAQE